MSLKNLKKIFVVCFLAGACTSLNARATLRFLDEWAKSLDYSNEKAKYVDLTWGAVAIETGFIHNLRFFGDYKIEVESGKRNYAKDRNPRVLPVGFYWAIKGKTKATFWKTWFILNSCVVAIRFLLGKIIYVIL